MPPATSRPRSAFLERLAELLQTGGRRLGGPYSKLFGSARHVGGRTQPSIFGRQVSAVEGLLFGSGDCRRITFGRRAVPVHDVVECCLHFVENFLFLGGHAALPGRSEDRGQTTEDR